MSGDETDEDARIQQLAHEVYEMFEQDERNDGTKFWKLKHERPEWMRDLAMKAHGGMMPDDWRYEEILDACARIHDASDVESSYEDIEADVYTASRLGWLASNFERADYCDQAMAEFGKESFDDLVSIIGAGQIKEREEIHFSVLQSLREHLAEMDAEDVDAGDGTD